MARQPWHRRPGESARAFEAFQIYKDLGAKRSTAKTAQELGKTKTQMDKWSSQHGWVDRVAAFEAHEVEKRERLSEDEFRENFQDRLRAHLELQEKTATTLGGLAIKLIAKAHKAVDALDLTPDDKGNVKIPPNLATLIRVTAYTAEVAGNSRAEALGVDELLEALGEKEQS